MTESTSINCDGIVQNVTLPEHPVESKGFVHLFVLSRLITLVQYSILIVFKARDLALHLCHISGSALLYLVEIMLVATVGVLELLYFWSDKEGYILEGETAVPFHFHTLHKLFWSNKALSISHPYLQVLTVPQVPPRAPPPEPPVTETSITLPGANTSPISLYSHRRKFNSLFQK